jgi:hypothetical protein
MKSVRSRQAQAEVVTRWTARGLTLAVMGFWLWFTVCSWFYEYPKEGWAGSQIHVFQTAIMVALLVLAYFFELAAGAAFIVLAGLSFYAWGRHNVFVALLMCLPMLLIGALYVAAWLLGRRRARAQTDESVAQAA